MPLYGGVGGAQKEINAVYAGVGGAVKQLNSLLAGVGGASKELLISKWKKYKIDYELIDKGTVTVTSYRLSSTKYSLSQFPKLETAYTIIAPRTRSAENFADSDDTYNSSAVTQERNVYFKTTDTKLYGTDFIAWLQDKSYQNYYISCTGGYTASNPPIIYSGRTGNSMLAISSYSIIDGEIQSVTGKCIRNKLIGPGDYISDITSNNPSEYPDNGIQNGYWYIKQ